MRLRPELAARRSSSRSAPLTGAAQPDAPAAAVGEAPARAEVRKALDKVANDPNLAAERTVNMLRWKEPEPVTDEPWWWQWANAAGALVPRFLRLDRRIGPAARLGARRARSRAARGLHRAARARARPAARAEGVRRAEPRARSRHSAGEPARRRRRRCARALAARRAARGARVAVSRPAVAPRARARRADSRVVDGRRVPRARSAAACRAERALRVASRRDLGRGRLRRARARRLRAVQALCGEFAAALDRKGARMRRPSAPTIIFVAFVLLVAAWVVVNTEWGEVEVPTPLRGDAATNPFYAAQKLVETLGATSERARVARRHERRCRRRAVDVGLGHRPSAPRRARALGRRRRPARRRRRADQRQRRVRGVERHRARARGARPRRGPFQAPEIVEPCRALVEGRRRRRTDGDAATATSYDACNFDYASLARDGRAARSGRLNDDGFLHGARVRPWGRAPSRSSTACRSSIASCSRAITASCSRGRDDLRAGDHVVFMSEADVALAAGARLAARRARRRGAAARSSRSRCGAARCGSGRSSRRASARAARSREQILGTGRFAVRVGGGAALVAAARRALHEAATRRIAGYERLTARRAGGSRRGARRRRRSRARRRARSREQDARPLELRAKLALLESARRQLVSRSQWSKHGKRI